jgi:hypothetical protein
LALPKTAFSSPGDHHLFCSIHADAPAKRILKRTYTAGVSQRLQVSQRRADRTSKLKS